ncbi:unnamed protein product [Prunus armeniaca]|uniref:Uncharacterized protein n=1 Tax=Prunus armeniaca TaxID=36596 RepID=A0A6J5V3T2_PRUAR|nr:unnamed protein product [Prunus armeniaca]
MPWQPATERALDLEAGRRLVARKVSPLARDKQAKELKSMNLENVHPHDYLNFYCLGNREKIPDTMAGSRDTEIAMGAYQLHHTLGERSSNT